MTADPKWLEILKASGWQTAALAAACAIFLWLNGRWFPALEPWMVQAAAFGLLVFGGLTFASVLAAAVRAFPVHDRLVLKLRQLDEAKAVEKYIPQMNEHEREIIAYLLARNQRSFTCAQDGGYAATLVGHGIVRWNLRPGHVAHPDDVPMIIPSHIWKVLARYRSVFGDPADPLDEDEPYPWRVPWNAR